MRLRFWPMLPLFSLGCIAPEPDRYDPPECEHCDWVVPFGSNVDVERLVVDGLHVYWLQRWTEQLLRVPVNGGEPELVADWLETSRTLLSDEQAIFTCEANPPSTLGNRIVRIEKADFSRSRLAAGNVTSAPALVGETLYYFDRSADGESQLWQQPSRGGARESVLFAGSALFPSRPAVLDDEIAWCAQVEAGVILFRYSRQEGVVLPQPLASEGWCPELLVADGELFGFSDRDGGTLIKFDADGPTWSKSDLTGDVSAASWSSSIVLGKLFLLTQLGGSSLVIIDADGHERWRKRTPFPIQAPAAADEEGIFVGGERALVRFPLPSEAPR